LRESRQRGKKRDRGQEKWNPTLAARTTTRQGWGTHVHLREEKFCRAQ